MLGTAAHARTAGDECASPITAVVGSNGPADTATMTPSANPPANESCTYLAWNNSKDVWYAYEAPVAGKLSLSFCESTFDTSVVVYQGTCGALTRIGCDDDSCLTSPGFRSAIVDLPVAAGSVYIRVGGYFGETGVVRFNLAFTPAPELGTLYSLGNNSFGQTVTQPTLGYIKAVASKANSFHTLALRANGTVAAWGDNSWGQCNFPSGLSDVQAIATGGTFSLALRSTGTVTSWGGTYGIPPAGLTGVVDIAAGTSHSIARKSDGTVVCWGWNGFGQITVPPGLPIVVDVDAAINYTLAARADGLVESWGDAPAPPPASLTNAFKVSAGGTFAAALRGDSTVVCWGTNNIGQCNVPAGLVGVTAIAAGYNHMLALRSDGSIVSWGSNGYDARQIPNAGAPYAFVAAGGNNSFVISRGDCNGNGTFDGLELAGHDCNGNDIPDCWDFELGFGEDCNHNGIGDECEKQATIAVASGQLSPIGFGAPKTMQISSAVPAVSEVELVITARGDFSGDLEYVRVVCGTQFERSVLAGAGDCVYSPQITLQLTADEFNDGIGADGTWRLDLLPSSAVNPALCPGGTWISVVARYTGASSADCDANGVIDSCQIAAGTAPDTNGNGIIDTCETAFDACPTDIDGDGVTGASDLAALLGAWGTSNPDIDFDADGSVGASDLATLLGAWGPCPVS
jgi:hypothetical protein